MGLPLAALLSFGWELGTLGLWLGLLASTLLQCSAMSFVALRLNWKAEADRAMANVDRHRTAMASVPGTPASGVSTPFVAAAGDLPLQTDGVQGELHLAQDGAHSL